MKTIQAVDLFAGAGGTSTGLLSVCSALGLGVELLAINHWDVAISTHVANHPGVRHICTSIEQIDPRKVVPGGHLDILCASPECVHFSNARGGKPMSDQSRAAAWHILHWAEVLDIDCILIENVREFQNWSALYPMDHPDPKKAGRPIPEEKGKYYRNFLRNLRCLGYTVEDRILNAANFGDATTRERLFIMARKGRKRIKWPEASHVPSDDLGLYPEAKRWRPAREIIDWSLPSTSIYGRKRPLVPNTLRRIYAGLEKFCGLPFVLGQQSCSAPRDVENPIPTVASAGAISLIQPYLVQLSHNGKGQNGDAHRCYSPDRPLVTVDGQSNIGLCEPFIIKTAHKGANGDYSYGMDHPLTTVTSKPEHSLLQPYLVKFHGSHAGKHDGDRRNHSVDCPIPTLDTANRIGLSEPFLVSFYGTGGPQSIHEPLNTVTAKDRFALISPELVEKGLEIWMLDIHFRMLQPHELSAAMSFPDGYEFKGTREQRVRQIGNAVPVMLAQALTTALLRDRATAERIEAA